MRPIAKPILTAGTLLIVVVFAGWLVLNAFLSLPATREQVRQEISRGVGMSVTIGSLTALPYPVGAIRIGGAGVENQGQSDQFRADSITIRPDWDSLLRGRVVAAALEMRNPSLRISQKRGATPSTTASGNSLASPPIRPESDLSKKPAAPPGETFTASRPLPKSLRITGGGFSYLDERGRPIVTLRGVVLTGSAERGIWSGRLEAAAAVIGSGMILRDLMADLTAPGNFASLDLDPLTASFGGGLLSGKGRLTSLWESPGYSLNLHLGNAGLERLLADASIGNSSAQGGVTGELRITGTAGRGATMNGEGKLLCKQVTVEPAAFLKQIGEFLNIDELKLLRLAEGKCLFRIDQGRFVIDDLFLRSENLILSAKGPLDSSGELNLDSRLLLNENLTGRLRGLLGNKLTTAPEPGYTQIPFHVSGPALNPRTDLLGRLTGIRIGGDLGGLGGLIQGLFGAPQPQPQPHASPLP